MLNMPKTQRSISLTTVAVAALVGGLAGAVVGLMFAPKSGKALRQGIQEKADKILHVEHVVLHPAEALKQQGTTGLVDKGKQLAKDLQTFIHESQKINVRTSNPIDIAKDTQPEEPLQAQTQVEEA